MVASSLFRVKEGGVIYKSEIDIRWCFAVADARLGGVCSCLPFSILFSILVGFQK